MAATRADLGQFFTPRAVIDFALQALVQVGADVSGARVCDPACGPGEWLQAALEHGASEAIGTDCDPAMVGRWLASGLARERRASLSVVDGLDPHIRLERLADIVLGNPPFGTDLAAAGEAALRHYAGHYRLPALLRNEQDATLFPHAPDRANIDRLRRFPAELLFLERFIQICRPGGWIAIILPEGVYSNRRWREVRRWLLQEITLHLVVALPRTAFRAHATTARTCLALMRREPAPRRHDVRLCAVDDCEPETLAGLLTLLSDGARAETPPPRLDLTPPVFID